MYQWITKYQWITILCLLLFFIFISVKNKECFSVGGQGNGGQGNGDNINISSNLYLTDVCNQLPKLVNGSSCVSNTSCQSGFCYPLNASYAEPTCQTKSDGTVENTELCIDYDNDLIDSINNYLNNQNFDNDNNKNKNENIDFLKEYFSKYNSSFICTNTPKSIDDINSLKMLYDESKDKDIYKMCEKFNNILPKQLQQVFKDNKHIPCYQFLNMSYCE
jgi:hypothetical protein